MANDLTELQSRITTDITHGQVTNTIALNEITSAIRNYETQRFYFNEQALAAVTLSATLTYAFTLFAPGGSASTASDIIEIDSVRVNIGTSRSYTLSEIGYERLNDEDENSTSTSGYPEVYAIYNRSIRIYPMPSASFTNLTAIISAHVKFPDLSAGTDSNCWTTDAKELIRCAAERNVYARYLKDYDAAQSLGTLEQLALAALRRRTSALGDRVIRSHL